MLVFIAYAQVGLFLLFFFYERFRPARAYIIAPNWDYWWIGLGIFGLIWLRFIFYGWVSFEYSGLIHLDMDIFKQGLFFYIIYSFGNYWFHRWKHSNRLLWSKLHYFHHAPSHMETRVAFFRHPSEVLVNTLYIFLLGKLVFGVSVEVIAIALVIEGCLETFHHANISISPKYRWIGYIIQIPEMHLVHHQYGLHRYNYSPFLWDTVFKTAYIPQIWDARLGFASSMHLGKLFIFKH